jgi:hypothetical protein
MEDSVRFHTQPKKIAYIFEGSVKDAVRDLTISLRIGVSRERDRFRDAAGLSPEYLEWQMAALLRSNSFEHHEHLQFASEEGDDAGCPVQAAMNLTLDEGFHEVLRYFITKETDYLTCRQMAEEVAEGKKPGGLVRRRLSSAERLGELDNIHSIY